MVSFTAANTKRMFSVSENNKKNRFYSTIHVFHCITYSKCYVSQFLKKYTKIKTNNQKPKKLLYYSLSRVFILRITISGRKECADKLAINSSLSLSLTCCTSEMRINNLVWVRIQIHKHAQNKFPSGLGVLLCTCEKHAELERMKITTNVSESLHACTTYGCRFLLW